MEKKAVKHENVNYGPLAHKQRDGTWIFWMHKIQFMANDLDRGIKQNRADIAELKKITKEHGEILANHQPLCQEVKNMILGMRFLDKVFGGFALRLPKIGAIIGAFVAALLFISSGYSALAKWLERFIE